MFPEIGIRGALDITLVAFLVYAILLWIKRAKAGLALIGILMLGGVYIMARQLELQLAVWILQGFLATFLILLVVIFQHELRQGFERIALWSFRTRKGTPSSDESIHCLLDALSQLAARHQGALVVIPGEDLLDRHLQGGIPLEGRLSSALLLSLFDPDSVGHDGAIIIKGDLVTRFSVQLPLSRDFEQLGQRGTRHSAALGLAERTDALSIVVSEEHGKISMAHNSILRQLNDLDELQAAIEDFFKEKREPQTRRIASLLLLRNNWLEKTTSVALALGLWVMFVSGGQGIRQVFQVPVHLDNVPAGLKVQSIEPAEIALTLSGARREFYFLDQTQLEVRVDASVVRPGKTSFRVFEEHVGHPSELSIIEMDPRVVKVSASAEESSAGHAQPQKDD